MKTRLDQLTMAEFIELLCGNTSVVMGKHEFPDPKKLERNVRDLILRYQEISDPAGFRIYLSDEEAEVKARMEVVIYTICHGLLAQQKYDEIREIMEECGINAGRMNEQRLSAEVESRLERAKAALTKIEAEKEDKKEAEVDIRAEFDKRTALMMSHFKFQIDTSTMKASVYASLVARLHAEIKAQADALKYRNN